MYKNRTSFFLFLLLPKRVRRERERERERESRSFMKPLCLFPFESKSLWYYNIPDANAISSCHISSNLLHVDTPPSSMPPTLNLVVTPSACHLHNACDHAILYHAAYSISAAFPLKPLRPVYFRNQIHYLFLFLVSDFFWHATHAIYAAYQINLQVNIRHMSLKQNLTKSIKYQ